jgi:hypothetical protein
MAGQPEAAKAEGPWDDPPPPHGVLLAALRWCWDSVYMITETGDGRLLITRADGRDSFHVASPMEAREAIITDFARCPVVWPFEAGVPGDSTAEGRP